jgi:hypothetical protein
MNRFDALTADLPGCPTRDFKTEHLGQGMLDYTLTPEGRIRRDGTGELVPYQGALRVVGHSTKDGGLRLWEYRLTFHQGRLQEIEPLLENAPTTFLEAGGGLWASGSEAREEDPEREPYG